MDNDMGEIYSEVYSILNLMDEKYIKKMPVKLYELIKNNRLETYNPEYDLSISLTSQNIKRKSVTMLVLLELNYWCETEEEKNEINDMLEKNSEEHNKMMKEKYSSDNIFKRINEARGIANTNKN